MDQRPSLPAARQRRQLPGLLPLALLLCAGCGPSQPIGTQPAPPMPVASPLRKQVLQGYMPFGSISWLNDTQIVFSGLEIGTQGSSSLYLWSIPEAPKQLLSNSPGACISNETIFAAQLSGKHKEKRYRLQPPDFKPELLAPLQPINTSKFEPSSCSRIKTPDALKGKTWKPLRKGQGFLDFSSKRHDDDTAILLHVSADQKAHLDTGGRLRTPIIPMAEYAAHDGSYLVYDLNVSNEELKQWSSSGKRQLWQLDTRWKAKAVDVPHGDWVSPNVSFLPTRQGLLIISNNFAPNHSAGGAGLYLLAPRAAAERLERGLVEEAAVSPNGRRIAYGFRPRLDTGIPEGGPRLVVLDICRPDISKDAPP